MSVLIIFCDAFGQFRVAVTLTFFILNLVVVVCINNVLPVCLAIFFSFDFKFGQDYVHNHDDVCIRVINLVREIRDNSLHVRDLDLFELNVIVRDFRT